uniref:Uncharacterized protein n=1 Tax=Myoviridae sp. ct2Qy24 TaxID=2827656 RepID=A0A8S5SSJ6_9CAUD|nr:MAG TPA: hypothetical protein [Myoviridae sp. ct2Qy24]
MIFSNSIKVISFPPPLESILSCPLLFCLLSLV